MDFERYSGIVQYEHAWAMDKRHIGMIFYIIQGSLIESVLEVGVFNGASTSAFIEAARLGKKLKIHLCDIRVRRPMRALCEGRCKGLDVQFFKRPSIQKDFGGYDCICIDGDHREKTTKIEAAKILKANPLLIFAHDTAYYRWCGKCKGPHTLAEIIKASGEYQTIEDAYDRTAMGERTHRGLFAAVRNDKHELWHFVKQIYDKERPEDEPKPAPTP